MLYNRYDDSVISCVASQREGSGFQTIVCVFLPWYSVFLSQSEDTVGA